MLFYYVNSSDRSSDVAEGSLVINNQIQQRSDNCQFTVFKNSKPIENQDIKIYDGDLISSISSNIITLQGKYEPNVSKFYPGQVLWVRIGQSNAEKVTVSAYNETTLTITLVAAPLITVSNNDRIGELIFGGIVSRVQDQNIQILQNLEYLVTGVDYTKIFDKKIVAATWADVDARYIINDACNTTINYNSTIDSLSYTSNAVIQPVWAQGGDASAPTVNLSDFLEGTSSGVFGWTFSGGVASWTNTFVAKDISDLTGVSSGTPTKGFAMLWAKLTTLTGVSSLKVRIGSSATNYAVITLAPTVAGDWGYLNSKLVNVSLVGTPDWTKTTLAAIVITETSSGSIKFNGLRINDQSAFSLYNIQSSISITDYRAAQIKPTQLLNDLANAFDYVWYIDYEKDVHFVTKETIASPFQITDLTDNFFDLKIEADVSNLGNRVIINGGEFTSTSTYSQVIAADGTARTWLLKSKFNNLIVRIDDDTFTQATTIGTTITNVHVIAHGLSVNDHITNRTRSNAVRQVLTVPDADHYTVESVMGQVSGDTISYFDTAVKLGIEGIDDESTVDYVYNSNEKSVRASSQTLVLPVGNFIRFAYNERVPLQFQYGDTASANALKALGFGDGIFDLAPITDGNISDINTAVLLAQAKVNQFSNPLILGTFNTDQRGLKSGQLLTINQTIGRSFSGTYVIQKVNVKQQAGQYQDYLQYQVTFGTTLFGWVEFMQKLLRNENSFSLNVDEIVEVFVVSDETIVSNDANALGFNGGFQYAKISEVPTITETNTAFLVAAGAWHWEPSVGQAVPTRWDLFAW